MCRMCQFTVANPMTGQTPRPRHVALLPPQKARTWSRLAVFFWQSGLCRRWIYLSRSTSTARTPEIGKARKKKRARGAAESEFQIEDVEAISGLWVYESMFLCGIERLRFCLIVLFRQPNHHRMKWQSIIQMICAQFEPPWLCLRHRWFSPSTSLMWCGLVAKPTW